ncbi:MAG: chloride channel protein, partial [Gemmatimonadetes bacterium]|nr:chloride channel protein [Gemmatimonadota bacterium]
MNQERSLVGIALAIGVVSGFSAAILVWMIGLIGDYLHVTHPSNLPWWALFAPAVGGLLVGPIVTKAAPETRGHGVPEVMLAVARNRGRIRARVAVLKALASAISVGSGFRGGLFFASLFLGAVFGACYSIALDLLLPGPHFDQGTYLVVGMAAMAAAIIGGPLTMTFLALEITGDFPLTIGVLLAVVIASLTVRRLFGYSFATWRFHLRGETIRSAHDVGWIRSLTVGRLMRRDLRTVADDVTLAAFRRQFPLGSTTRVIAIDPAGHYAGIVPVPAAHQVPAATVEQGATVASILTHREDFLRSIASLAFICGSRKSSRCV